MCLVVVFNGVTSLLWGDRRFRFQCALLALFGWIWRICCRTHNNHGNFAHCDCSVLVGAKMCENESEIRINAASNELNPSWFRYKPNVMTRERKLWRDDLVCVVVYGLRGKCIRQRGVAKWNQVNCFAASFQKMAHLLNKPLFVSHCVLLAIIRWIKPSFSHQKLDPLLFFFLHCVLRH